MIRHSFTKVYLDNLKPAEIGKRYMVYDSIRPELAIRITDNDIKSFIIQKRHNGKILKITLGKYPSMSINQAREKALEELNKLSSGVNPNEEKNKINNEITLKNLFETYIVRYSKQFKKSWKYDQTDISRFCILWFNRKISTITKQEVQELHEKIRINNGLYQANRLLSRIQSMYSKAIEWGYKGENPAKNIKKFKEEKRDRFLKPEELPLFFKSINNYPNQQIRDFIYIALLTGARKSNILSMKWSDIDIENKIWRIPDTKNGDPYIINLTCQSLEILNRLKQTKINDWAFPSSNSKSGHLEDPKKAFKTICKEANIINLRIHDLRRTFCSYQAILGSSMLIIGKSAGHKSLQSTEIYARLSQDPIRESVSKATNKIWELGNSESN